ncbi:hypothetical protein RDABS01_022508 [Bienertia sinuspersici]
MWKFRRGFYLLNLSYEFCLGVHVKPSNPCKIGVSNYVAAIKLNPYAENLEYPCCYTPQIQFFCSTASDASNLDTNLTKFASVTDENECANDDNDGFTGEGDEIDSGKLGFSDDKIKHDLGVILEILKSTGSKNNLEQGINSCDKSSVISGTEVTNKLNQCGISISHELVIEVLSRCRNDWELAFLFFLWAGKQPGYEHSVRIYHSIISILAKKRKFDTAWTVIDKMRRRGIMNPNTLLIMIRRYSAVHDVVNAINTFHAFKRFNFPIGMEEFQKLLSALTRYKNVQEAEQLLFSNKNTYHFNSKSFNIILNGWCNVVCSPREANRFWRLMSDLRVKLDVISFSSIISCYSKLGRLKEVLKLFEQMKEMGIEPDRKAYNAILHALAKEGRAKDISNLLQTMEDKGIAPDVVTYNSLIKPLCRARKRDEAESLFSEMLNRGLQPTVRTFHAFLRIQRTGEDIFKLLDKMELACHPNQDTYLLLIRKFCRWGQLDNAFKLWDKMAERGLNEDASSYLALIRGLFLNGKLEEAHKIYLEMKEKELHPDAKTDELIQTWLSIKQMAESDTVITEEASLMDNSHVPSKTKGFTKHFDQGSDATRQPEFRKVVTEKGFSFCE